MNAIKQSNKQLTWIGVGALFLMLSGCAGTGGGMGTVTLEGAQENPPVVTSATGTTNIRVAADMTVSGSVTTTGVAATAAHIHTAPAGMNGPVLIGLIKTSDNVWSVPPGAKLTDAQYADYKAGKLYVNVHSVANKGGEIRAQLRP